MDLEKDKKEVVTTSAAPGAIGPYSQAVKVGNLMFTSGQLPIDPATGKIPDGPISVRAHQVIKNLQGIITAVGSSVDDVLKTTVFLTNIGDFQEVNAVYAEYFKPPYPARSAIQVAALPLATDIEIEAVVLVK